MRPSFLVVVFFVIFGESNFHSIGEGLRSRVCARNCFFLVVVSGSVCCPSCGSQVCTESCYVAQALD